MPEVRRIGPDGGFIREFSDFRDRVKSLETRPAGNVYIRETLTTEDPVTGEKTIFGQLPDGSYGIQPFVGDITPPPVATTPVVYTQPGLIAVSWDGKFVGNAAKPRDFEQVNVIGHKMSGTTTTLSIVVGLIRHENATCYISEDMIAEDETWQFSFQSEDFNGNKSANSARTATITMIGIMSPALVEGKLQELRDEDTALHDRADETQANLADAQAIADALLAKGSNLLVNGDFDLPIKNPPTGWPTRILTYVEPASASGITARSGDNILRAAPTTTTAYAYSDWVNSAKDRTYSAEMWVRLNATAPVASGALGFYFTALKMDGTTNAAIQNNKDGIDGVALTAGNLTTTGWTKITAKYTVGVDCTKIRFGPRLTGAGNVYFVDSMKVIDITEAEAAQVTASQAFNTAEQAAEAAGTAGTAANSKNKNWFQNEPPAGIDHKNGDTWFDTNDDNRIYVWDATAGALGTGAWIDMRDKAIAAATMAVSGAQATANGKNTNYYGPTAPTGGTYKDGDIYFNTAQGNKLYIYSTSGGTSAFKPFQDTAISIANTAATGAQATADSKNKSYYTDTAPTNVPAGTLKAGDLWFNTGVGQGNRLSTWSGTAWQTTQDSALALLEAAKKGRTFTQSVQPAVEFRNANNVWIDTSLGINNAVTKYWNPALNAGAGGWEAVKDNAISQAQLDAALDAQEKADAAYTAAINAQAYSNNASFDDWDGTTLPNGFTIFGTSVAVKETTLVRKAPYALRYNVPDTATQAGANINSAVILGHAPNLEYYTVEVDLYLVSGTLSGAGVLLDWAGMTNNRATVDFASALSNAATGKWHRVSKVVRRPANATGTWTGMDGYLMANYTNLGGAAKEIVFDWFNVRPSTAEEILSYTAPTISYVDASSVSASAAAAAAASSDATTKANNAQAAAIADTNTKMLGKNKTVWSTSPASGTTGYIAGDTWFQRDATGAVIAQWEFTTSWQSRTVSELVIGGISAGKIISGTIDADRIGSNTITAEKIFVGDFTNLLTNGFGDLGAGKGWASGLIYEAVDKPAGVTGVFKSTAGQGTTAMTATMFNVSPNTEYVTEVWIKADKPNSKIYIELRDQNAAHGTSNVSIDGKGAASSVYPISNLTVPTVWTKYICSTTATASATKLRVGSVYFNHPNGTELTATVSLAISIRRRVGGELIVDGAIDGKTITGPTIQTNSAAASGIKLTPTELAGYDASGQKNFSLTTGGTLAVRGTIQSGSTISGATLSASGIYTNPADLRGVKIKDTGIRAWDATGTPTFVLDAATGQVEVPGLKANSITGDMVAANTISVANLAVTDLTNFAPSLAESPKDWILTGGMAIINSSLDDSGKRLETDATTGTSWAYGPYRSVTAGETLYAAATLYRSSGATGSAYLRYYFYDANKAVLASPNNYTGSAQSATSVSDTKFEVVATVPPGAAYTRLVLAITSTVASNGFYNILGRRMTAGKLIVDGSITTDHMTSNTIDAKVIAAGTLTGDKIEAGSISAEKLTVGIGTNLIPDPGFVNPGMTELRESSSTTGLDVYASTVSQNLVLVTPTTGTYYFRATGVLQSATTYRDWIPVVPGEKYVFSAEMTLPVGMTGDIRLTGRIKDGSAGSISFAAVPTDPSDPLVLNTFPTLSAGTRVVSYYAEVPSDCYWMLPEIRLASVAGTATITANTLSLRRRSTGELIVDGSITTDHMTSGSIDAHVLSANSITGDLIAADAITAKLVSVGDFTNIATGGGFDTPGDKANWPLVPGTSWSSVSPAPGSLGYLVASASASTRTLYLSNKPSVQPGDEYFISLMYKTSSDYAGGGGNAKFRVGDQVNGYESAVTYLTASTPWTAVTGSYKVPATGVNSLTLSLVFDHTVGTVSIDNLVMRKKSGATLIEQNAITTDHIRSGAIDASKIAAGSITASAIGSKSITADKLIVSSTNNLIVESDFSNGGVSWDDPGSTRAVVAGAGRGGTDALRFTGTTASQSRYNIPNKVPIDSDSRYRASIWIKSSVALTTTNAIRMGIKPYSGPTASAPILWLSNNTDPTHDNYVPANVWTQITAISPKLASTVVAGEFYIASTQPSSTTTIDIDSVSITRAADGKLVVDGEITATKLETNLVLTSKIIAGPSGGTHAEMSQLGFKVFAKNPAVTGGAPQEVIRLGVDNTDDYFAITNTVGESVGNITASGDTSFSSMTLNAYSPSSSTGGLFYGGNEFSKIIDNLPKGIVAAAYRDTQSTVNAETTANIPFLRMEVEIKKNRIYKLWTSPVKISRTAGSVVVGIKYATGSSTLATLASGSLVEDTVWDESNGVVLQELFSSTVDTRFSFLMWMGVSGGSAGFRPTPSAPTRMVVEDVGPANNNITLGVHLNGTVVNTPSKQTYVKQYAATGSRSYTGTGADYPFDTGRMYQGLSPAGYGNLRSLAFFNNSAMTADLSGATINYMRVYFNFAHWYYNAGGTAQIGVHNVSSAPATWTPPGTWTAFSSGWPKPGARWVDISSGHWAQFAAGTLKGVYLEGDSTYNTYGIADRPTIEISYTK